MAVIKTTPPATPPSNAKTAPSSPQPGQWKLVTRSPPRRSSGTPFLPGQRPSNSPNWRVKAPKRLSPPGLLGQQAAWNRFSRCSSPGEKSQTSRSRSNSRSSTPSHGDTLGLPPVVPGPRRHSYSGQTASKVSPVRRTNSWGALPGKLDPKASEFKASDLDSISKNLLGGKLCMLCTRFFAEAYGLGGHARKDHAEVVQEAKTLTGCSERAIHETLYGHSYSDQLKAMREQIPDYPPKCRTKDRAAQLAQILQHPEKYPFLSFDGSQPAAAPTTDSAEADTSAPKDSTPATDSPATPAKQPVDDSTPTTPSATTLLSVERVQGAIVGLALAALPLVAQALV